ncbi:MAG: hypothetical protein IKR11_04260 [Solobacterium sp.]|nr:hypothetical protein [Solobacterium sp.]
MQKILTATCIVMICIFTLTGCIKKSLPGLPDNAIAFEMETFQDKKHDDALFGTIEYNGRVYIPYGTINNHYNQSHIASCIGYIIQDEQSSSVVDPNNTDRRIYTLSNDPEHNFLMEYDASTKLMNQPGFFRAMDTKGKSIFIPNYIDTLEYEFWEE